MNEHPVTSALREVQRVFANPRALAVLGVVALILGLSGPFETYTQLSLGGRLAYWIFITFLTGAAGIFGGSVGARFFAWMKPEWLGHVVFGGIASGVSAGLVVFIINLTAFGPPAVASQEFVLILLYCLVVGVGVSWLFRVFRNSDPRKQDVAPSDPSPRLLARLPAHLRGALHHLSVEDHYVQVHTARGTHMVLMRLKDAISECAPTKGLQIHRSHWVAENAVTQVERKNGKTFVVTPNDVRLPVSRSFLPQVRAAGWLDQR